ncbi:ubiquinol oxidase subunit II [Teichococcus oryzae]
MRMRGVAARLAMGSWMRSWFKHSRHALLPSCLALLLTGCAGGVLDPKGPIGLAERSLIWTATWMMLLVVVPVIGMTIWFAWRYRASNKAARYEPNWDHSTRIEAVVWAIPCVIILFLAIITWKTTHELDPYKPIEAEVPPVQVQVVSLDWKWLFIYPELGIATVNEMAMPTNVPVQFHITSGSVMNAFFIPRLGSMIYSMAGMTTKLALLSSEDGIYDGMSSHYSGAGFSGMKFKAHSTDQAGFDAWVEKVRASGATLDMAAYERLAEPSENNPVAYYGNVTPSIFGAILHHSAPGMLMHPPAAADPAAPASPHAGGHAEGHEGHEGHAMRAADAGAHGHVGHKE